MILFKLKYYDITTEIYSFFINIFHINKKYQKRLTFKSMDLN